MQLSKTLSYVDNLAKKGNIFIAFSIYKRFKSVVPFLNAFSEDLIILKEIPPLPFVLYH